MARHHQKNIRRSLDCDSIRAEVADFVAVALLHSPLDGDGVALRLVDNAGQVIHEYDPVDLRRAISHQIGRALWEIE